MRWTNVSKDVIFLFYFFPLCEIGRIVWIYTLSHNSDFFFLSVRHSAKSPFMFHTNHTVCARRGLSEDHYLYSNFIEWGFKSNVPQALQSQTQLEPHRVSGHCSNLSIAWANLCRTLSAGSALYLQPTMLAEPMPPLLHYSTVHVFCYFAPFPCIHLWAVLFNLALVVSGASSQPSEYIATVDY